MLDLKLLKSNLKTMEYGVYDKVQRLQSERLELRGVDYPLEKALRIPVLLTVQNSNISNQRAVPRDCEQQCTIEAGSVFESQLLEQGTTIGDIERGRLVEGQSVDTQLAKKKVLSESLTERRGMFSGGTSCLSTGCDGGRVGCLEMASPVFRPVSATEAPRFC